MNPFIQNHADDIKGQLTGIDRIRFRGTILKIAYALGLLKVMNVALYCFSRNWNFVTLEIRTFSLEVSTMSDKKRRHFDNAFKAQIVRRHLANKEPVSVLAAELEVQPSLIHHWISVALQDIEQSFSMLSRPKPVVNADRKRIEVLEAKLALKNEVISELLEENLRSKKVAGVH